MDKDKANKLLHEIVIIAQEMKIEANRHCKKSTELAMKLAQLKFEVGNAIEE